MLPAGFPIRKSLDHSSVTSSPRLIAGSYVLHRLLVPRHPPCALKNLTTKIKDARVHCAVLKLRTATTPHTDARPLHPHTRGTNERYTAGRPARETRPRPPHHRQHTPAAQERGTLIPQDPTACQAPTTPEPTRSHPGHTPQEGHG